MKCVVVGCDRSRAKDSDRCSDHRWAQWSLREPEGVRRAKANALVVKDYSGRAA